MPDRVRSVRAARRAFILVAALADVACAPPIRLGVAPMRARLAGPLSTETNDGILRAGHDSDVVKVSGRNGREEIFTLRREVIDAYLETVASVSAALRKN